MTHVTVEVFESPDTLTDITPTKGTTTVKTSLLNLRVRTDAGWTGIVTGLSRIPGYYQVTPVSRKDAALGIDGEPTSVPFLHEELTVLPERGR